MICHFWSIATRCQSEKVKRVESVQVVDENETRSGAKHMS